MTDALHVYGAWLKTLFFTRDHWLSIIVSTYIHVSFAVLNFTF